MISLNFLFRLCYCRKQVMCPFLTVGAVGEYDVTSEVIGGGHSGKRLLFQKENTKITML